MIDNNKNEKELNINNNKFYNSRDYINLNIFYFILINTILILWSFREGKLIGYKNIISLINLKII